MDRYRNSQLRQRRTCGLAYRLTYIDRKPGLPSPALQAGQRVHAAVAELVRRVVAGDAIDVHDIAFRIVRGGDVEYADALRVLTRLQEALGTEFAIDERGVFLIEEEIEMPLRLWGGTEVVFFGTPDLVERVSRRRCRITDFKTHWHPMTKEECEADPQLRRYTLLIQHHYPAFEEFELVRRFVRYSNNFHEEVITTEDLPRVRDALASEILATREMDEAGEFDPSGGSWCALCRHHGSCPLIARYREEGLAAWIEVGDDEDARQIAGDVVALEAARARLRNQLARYLGDRHPRGAIPVVGGEYGFHSTEHRSLTPADLEQALSSQGIEMPEDVLSVDLDALDRFARKLPESAVQAVERATVRSQGTRFTFRRTPPTPTTETRTPAAEPGELFDE